MPTPERTPPAKSTPSAASHTPPVEPSNPNPATESNLTDSGRIATHKDDLDADRPGFHCGYCGQDVGPEGQHWNEKGEAVANPHAGTLVVANNWPENQDAQDEAKYADVQTDSDKTEDGPVSDKTRTDGTSK